MVKTIVLVRHGEAEPTSGGKTDFDRNITPKGHKDILQLGKVIEAQQVVPQLIVASPYLRTQQTAEILRDAFKLDTVVSEQALTSETGMEETIELIYRSTKKYDRALFVGHEPNISAVAVSLCQGGGRNVLGMAPGSAVILQFWQEVEKGKGTLIGFVRPGD